ncbi:MAG: putative rhs-related protein [Massilia sp.]|jgi:hypothetical protein|nr:putative rhs-related protein [Massilia sp.]
MSFDKDKFATYLRKHSKPHSQGRCARALRQALEAGGASTKGHPVDAREYGPTLERNGFYVVAFTNLDGYVPIKGDIVVFAAHPGGNSSGHIQAYDGRRWISDFTQRRFWPASGYEREEAVYVVYRR